VTSASPVAPDDDPVILALERDEAYATVTHHVEMREQAERNEKYQILCRRLLMPKVYAFIAIERMLAEQSVVATMDDGDLLDKIAARLKMANDELESLVSGDPESKRIFENGLDTMYGSL
jgi:predicted  nucleic acid-binding Zn-ribbon protein